jgi:energy-coupling factor transporter ATP-binding protein EcfA2
VIETDSDEVVEVAPLGHLEEIAIEGLFGGRDFSFKLDKEEPTILTGSNGSGKSTLLRIINAIGTDDWSTLSRQPFDRAVLSFESGQVFAVERDEDKLLKVRLDGESYEIASQFEGV